ARPRRAPKPDVGQRTGRTDGPRPRRANGTRFHQNPVKDHPTMKNRRHTLLWMRDLLDHMSRCHDQLQWASDGAARLLLAESMLGDLAECQRLCQELRSEPEAMGLTGPMHELALS